MSLEMSRAVASVSTRSLWISVHAADLFGIDLVDLNYSGSL